MLFEGDRRRLGESSFSVREMTRVLRSLRGLGSRGTGANSAAGARETATDETPPRLAELCMRTLNAERLSVLAASERHMSIGASGYIGFLFGFLDGWIGGGGVPPAKPLRSYQCGKSPLGSLGGSARFSRDSSVSLYSIPGQ